MIVVPLLAFEIAMNQMSAKFVVFFLAVVFGSGHVPPPPQLSSHNLKTGCKGIAVMGAHCPTRLIRILSSGAILMGWGRPFAAERYTVGSAFVCLK